MAGIKFEGLDEFQKDLLEVAQVKLPRESFKIMRKIGSRAAVHIRREARAKVKRKTGTYHKRFKRGRVFKDVEGNYVVRVINSAPHAHLIEHGHRVVRGDVEIGFAPGKKVMDTGAKKFDSSGEFEKMLSDWLDDLLDSGNL